MKTYLFESCGSTMDVAKMVRRSRDGVGLPSVPFAVVARHQTAGRGRLGRRWEQAPGIDLAPNAPPLSEENGPENGTEIALGVNQFSESSMQFDHLAFVYDTVEDFLPLTIVVPTSFINIPLSWVSLTVASAVYDALLKTVSNFLSLTIGIYLDSPDSRLFVKWPNDIMTLQNDFVQKKICGILCESASVNGQIDSVLLGIGLNFFSHPMLDTSASFVACLIPDSLSSHHRKKVLKAFNKQSFRHFILKNFSNLLVDELYEYCFVQRPVKQLKMLVESKMYPLGTLLRRDDCSEFGAFKGLSLDGAILIDGQDAPIYSGDVIVKPHFLGSSQEDKSKDDTFDEIPTKLEKKIKKGRMPASRSNLVYINSRTKNLNSQQNTHRPRTKTPGDTVPLENILQNSSTARLFGFPRGPQVYAHSGGQDFFKKNRLFLDLGNSVAHFLLVSESPLLEKFYEIPFASDMSLVKDLDLRPLAEMLGPFRHEPINLVVASVRTPLETKNVVSYLDAFLVKMFPELKLTTKIVSLKDFPHLDDLLHQYAVTLGMDRAFRFSRARRHATHLRAPVIVCSLGTATTVEMVDAEGNIVDSSIAPGVGMALASLSSNTSLLPLVTVASPSGDAIASNKVWSTEVSLQRGAWFAALGPLLFALSSYPVALVLFTGGYSLLLQGSEVFLQLESLFSDVEFQFENHVELTELKELTLGNSSEIKDKSLGIETANIEENMKERRTLDYEAGSLVSEDSLFRRIGGRMENIGVSDRIDGFLGKKFAFHTRDVWAARVDAFEVKVEHHSPKNPFEGHKPMLTSVKKTYRLKPFDQIWVFHPPEHEPAMLSKLQIGYDDGDIVAFHKPPNMVVHAAGMYGRNTFVELAKKMGYGNAAAVHRIDRETSGLLLCARSYLSRKILSSCFREGFVSKLYMAVTKGIKPPEELFLVNMPIGKDESSKIRLKMGVGTPLSLPAKTLFRCLASHGDLHLWLCSPLTGRTNQIRVHFHALGMWIVGDKMYHPDESVFIEFYEKGYTDWVREKVIVPRHYLHNLALAISSGIEAAKLVGLNETFLREGVVIPPSEDMREQEFFNVLLKKAGLSGNETDFIKKIRVHFETLVQLDIDGIREYGLENRNF